MKLFLENGCTADLLVIALVAGQLIAGMCAEVEVGHRQELHLQRHLQQAPEGQAAPCGRFPYIVSLQDLSRLHKCSGTLVAPIWVLTAAHCVDANDPQSLGTRPIAVIGACNLNDTEKTNGIVEVQRVVSTVINPNYSRSFEDGYDVALLQLATPSLFTPPGLPPLMNRLRPLADLVAVGWQGADIEAPPEELQIITNFTVLPNALCNSTKVWDGLIKETMICGQDDWKDTCIWESGGPLLSLFTPNGDLLAGRPELDVLWGILSFGDRVASCMGNGRPDVYTNVGSVYSWIDMVMSKTDSQKEKTAIASAATEAPMNKSSRSKSTSAISFAFSTRRASQQSVGIIKGVKCTPAPPLHLAVQDGLLAEIRDILDAFPDVDTRRGCDGATALLLASVAGSVDVVDLLIDSGADVDIPDDNGLTPLIASSTNGHSTVVEHLLRAGADPNKTDRDGNTALGFALRTTGEASMKIVEELLAAGVKVNGNGLDGHTPLAIAAIYGNTEGMQILLEKGADKSVVDADGKTAVELLCSCLNNADDAQSPECPAGGCDDRPLMAVIAKLIAANEQPPPLFGVCDNLPAPVDTLSCILDRKLSSG